MLFYVFLLTILLIAVQRVQPVQFTINKQICVYSRKYDSRVGKRIVLFLDHLGVEGSKRILNQHVRMRM